jgi:hypothetical protein
VDGDGYPRKEAMRCTTWLALLSVFVSPVTVLTGAGCVCPLIDYHEGLQLHLAPFSTPAAYRIDIEAEGDLVSLRYDVAAGRGVQCVGTCSITAEHVAVSDLSFGSPDELTVKIERLEGNPGPKRVTVRLFRDDVLLTEETLEPHYKTEHPDGLTCGERVFADSTIDVP